MLEMNLGFAEACYHNGILEVTAHADQEINVDKVDQLLETFAALDPPAKFILANRVNDYSFTYEAMERIIQINSIHALAEVNYGRNTTATPDILWPRFFKLAFFSRREDAIIWLLQAQKEIAESHSLS